MKKTMILLNMLVALAIVSFLTSGCYRSNWYRANTTYAELRAESEWCKSQTNIGSTKAEMKDQYEKCMKNKRYNLKAREKKEVNKETKKDSESPGPPSNVFMEYYENKGFGWEGKEK